MRDFRTRLLSAFVGVVVIAVATPSAIAAERVRAVFFQTFDPATYTIDQGELVSFRNTDPFLRHGVASDAGAGSPQFSAAVIRKRHTRLVRGAPFLPTGSYPFHCPIHPKMTATLEIGPGGTPRPTDRRRPSASLKLLSPRAGKVIRERRLKLRVTLDEPVDAVIEARFGKQTIGLREATLIRTGDRVLLVKIEKAGARALKLAAAAASLRGARSIPISVTAKLSDLAGLRRQVQLTAKLSLGSGG